MEIQMNDFVTVETEVPLLAIHEFYFVWKLNQHGVLKMKGLLKPNVSYHTEEIFDSKVKIKKGKGENRETIFCGCLINMEVAIAGNVGTVNLEIATGSCKLDRKKGSQSFQNVEDTYEDTVRCVVESGGGRVICTAGKETAIDKPVIRYLETEWEFVKRLASHLGTYVIADVEVGKPNFWFGFPNGKEISVFATEDYHVYIQRSGNGTDVKQAVYEAQSREFHQLGNRTIFWGQAVMVCEVRGEYQCGELLFTYLLAEVKDSPIIYQERFTGMELLGSVEEVIDEQIRIALDIDGGVSTGSYFYGWYPETGNGMYAVPEKGTKIFLTFGNSDEREGFAGRCMPMDTDEKLSYQNRSLMTQEGNTMFLNEAQVNISAKQKHKFSLSDHSVSLVTTEKLRIKSTGNIKLQAKDIYVKTLDVIKVHQG